MKIKYELPSDYVVRLMQRIGIDNTNSLNDFAFGLLEWYLEQMEQGKKIIVVNKKDTELEIDEIIQKFRKKKTGAYHE